LILVFLHFDDNLFGNRPGKPFPRVEGNDRPTHGIEVVASRNGLRGQSMVAMSGPAVESDRSHGDSSGSTRFWQVKKLDGKMCRNRYRQVL
jgi:hypothetical protein